MLGDKIRQKRLEQQMSMKELADMTGLTAGFLSQIERDLAEPSIASLRKIAEALNVAIFHFFVEDGEGHKVVRKEARQKIQFPDANMTYELLSPDVNHKMECLYGTLKAGGRTGETVASHEGEEFTYVFKGSMHMVIADEDHHLAEGDAIYYEGTLPHQIRNSGDEDLEFLTVITPPRF